MTSKAPTKYRNCLHVSLMDGPGRGYRAWARALHLWQSCENLSHEVVTVWTPLVWVVFWLRSLANKSRFNLTAVSDFFGGHRYDTRGLRGLPVRAVRRGMQIFVGTSAPERLPTLVPKPSSAILVSPPGEHRQVPLMYSH